MTPQLFMVLKFFIGGGIIASVTWLAHYVDPKYGGILAAAPITTTLAFIFTGLRLHRQPPRTWSSHPSISQYPRSSSCWSSSCS